MLQCSKPHWGYNVTWTSQKQTMQNHKTTDFLFASNDYVIISQLFWLHNAISSVTWSISQIRKDSWSMNVSIQRSTYCPGLPWQTKHKKSCNFIWMQAVFKVLHGHSFVIQNKHFFIVVDFVQFRDSIHLKIPKFFQFI